MTCMDFTTLKTTMGYVKKSAWANYGAKDFISLLELINNRLITLYLHIAAPLCRLVDRKRSSKNSEILKTATRKRQTSVTWKKNSWSTSLNLKTQCILKKRMTLKVLIDPAEILCFEMTWIIVQHPAIIFKNTNVQNWLLVKKTNIPLVRVGFESDYHPSKRSA